MTEAIWLAGMMFANLWSAGVFDSPNGVEKGAIHELVKRGTNVGYKSAPAPAKEAPARALSTDARTLIHPALKAGERPCCEQPPSKAAILRALPALPPSIPFAYEQYRDEVEIIVEKLVDKVDAPRFYPLVGPAQLHHCHWKCTVRFNDVVEMSYPFAFKDKKRRAEVVYLDTDSLYLHKGETNDRGAETSEPPLYCPGGHFKPETKSVTIVPVVAKVIRNLYVIVDDGVEQKVTTLPAEEQSVLDVVMSSIKSMSADKVRKVRVSRANSAELPVDWHAITRDGQTASNYQLEAGDRVHVFVEPAKTPRSETMTLDDVVRMSKAGVATKIILRQMEQTGANFNLSADDIVYLRERGVSNRVIGAMQERRSEVLVFPPAMTKYATTGYPEQAFDKMTDPDRTVHDVKTHWHDLLQTVEDQVNKDESLTGLSGRVWLTNRDGKQFVGADGAIHIEVFDRGGDTPIKLGEWRFDNASLKRLLKTDVVGMGYTLFLPGVRSDVERVEIRVVYMPENGDCPQRVEQILHLKASPK